MCALLVIAAVAGAREGGSSPEDAAPRYPDDGAGADWVLRAPGPAGVLLRAAAARLGLSLEEVWPALGAFRATLSPAQLDALARAVPLLAEPDVMAHATLNTATTWFGAAKAQASLGVTGDRDGTAASYSSLDVGICVVDTGIDAAHPDLDGGKVRAWRDFVQGLASPYDDQGHGTHVASIAAGSGDLGGAAFRGVAPGAFLAIAKTLDSAGSGPISRIIDGVRWCTQQAGVRVINLSLGTSGCSDGRDALSAAVDEAQALGFVVVAAAGNSGPAFCTIGSPGGAAGAITVGALADPGEGGIRLASFSSRGPTLDGRAKPDITAPGVGITAAAAGSNYVAMSGTSMAAPYIAGTVALMLDANPDLTPAQVRANLTKTAGDWGKSGPDSDWGAGRVKTFDAVKVVGGLSGTGPGVGATKSWRAVLGKTGAMWTAKLNVTNAQPFAITMLHETNIVCSNNCTPDLDLYLYAPGTPLGGSAAERHARAAGWSDGLTRQESTWRWAPTPGQWTIEVYSFSGAAAAIVSAGYA